MSTYNPMQYLLSYHVTTLQEIYGLIPVLPTTSDQMEVKVVFQNNVVGNMEQKMDMYISDST